MADEHKSSLVERFGMLLPLHLPRQGLVPSVKLAGLCLWIQTLFLLGRVCRSTPSTSGVLPCCPPFWSRVPDLHVSWDSPLELSPPIGLVMRDHCFHCQSQSFRSLVPGGVGHGREGGGALMWLFMWLSWLWISGMLIAILFPGMSWPRLPILSKRLRSRDSRRWCACLVALRKSFKFRRAADVLQLWFPCSQTWPILWLGKVWAVMGTFVGSVEHLLDFNRLVLCLSGTTELRSWGLIDLCVLRGWNSMGGPSGILVSFFLMICGFLLRNQMPWFGQMISVMPICRRCKMNQKMRYFS